MSFCNGSGLLNDTLNIAILSICIPVFSGEPAKWGEFMDLYEDNNHNNASLKNSVKLKLLQVHLKGEALKVIRRNNQHLQSENYERIYESLCERYNRKRSFSRCFRERIIV